MLAKQTDPGLTNYELKVLTAAQDRLTSWQNVRRKEKAMVKLLEQTAFSEKKTNRHTNMDHAEETARLHASWQLYDYILWLTAKGSQEELSHFVQNTERYRLGWRQTALTFTDQIPVWLKVEAGRQAQSMKRTSRLRRQQHARRDTRKAFKSGSEPDALTAATAAASESYLTSSPGDPAASRYRITYCARQAVENCSHFQAPASQSLDCSR